MFVLFQNIVEFIMSYPTVIILTLLTLTTSAVSALQALDLPTNSASPGKPAVVPVPGWTYRGCFTDQIYPVSLTGKKWTGNITPGSCATFCRGFRYFGLESGNEWDPFLIVLLLVITQLTGVRCYCGNTVAPASRRSSFRNRQSSVCNVFRAARHVARFLVSQHEFAL